MPHLTLEYTSNLAHKRPTAELLLRLHHLLESTAGIRVANCKSRWREVGEWVVGNGEGESAFVHLDIRLLEGRPREVQQAVGRGAAEILMAHFLPAPEEVDLQITVEVLEIRRVFYFKHPPGTLSPPILPQA